jgi:hypothetical protein
MNGMEIMEMVKNMRKEQEMFQTVDINDLLASIEKENHDYLENKSFKSIAEDIYLVLNSIESISQLEKEALCDKLKDFFLVKDISELRKSRYLRYIKKGGAKLSCGGFFTKLFVNNDIVYIGMVIFGGRFISVRYDDCIFFQKLTDDEKIILLSFDYIEQFHDESHEIMHG